MTTTITFLFTDIEASTQLWETADDGDTNDLVEAHFEVLRATVFGAGGDVFATMGDGIAAAFGSVADATCAAITARKALTELGVRVRMGLHTGEAHKAGADYRGRAVNRAARVTAAAHGQQIVASDVTAGLIRMAMDDVVLTDLGVHRLRDLAEPEHLWQVDPVGVPAQLFPSPRGLDAAANNLPTLRTSFHGRGTEIDRVVASVQAHALTTITGVGGVGKTRLAAHAAAEVLGRFPSVWFVDLAHLDDPDDVPATVAIAAGLTPAGETVDNLVPLFRDHAGLMVLDNCEHLLDAVADVVDVLTSSCPRIAVLATSREPLVVDGEHIIAVRPLRTADAVDLFEQRALAAGANLDLADESQRALVTHVCEQLDGLPLAIELAASRVPSLGLGAVVAALDDRFSLLVGGRRRAVERQQALRATVDWSYRLLESDEQQLLQHVSVFKGGFELDTVRHVAKRLLIDAQDATDLLESLVRKSMIEVDELSTGTRYRLLQTVRLFVADMLDHSGRAGAADRRAADWVASLTDWPYEHFGAARVERAAIRLEREADNWRHAVLVARREADADLAARLCGPATVYFLLGRHDLASEVEPLLDLCPEPLHRRNVLVCLAVARAAVSSRAQLRAWADEIAALEPQPTGASHLVEWMARSWFDDREAAVDISLAAMRDPRISADCRDMFATIALVDRFSKTTTTDDRDNLTAHVVEIIGRTEVMTNRVVGRLGLGWASLPDHPVAALGYARAALADMLHLPVYLQRMLPGSASRLIASVDPTLAAAELLPHVRATPPSDSFHSLLPSVHSALLLHRIGHPAAGPAIAGLAATSVAPFFAWAGHTRTARAARAAHPPMSVEGIVTLLTAALAEVGATNGGSVASSAHDTTDERLLPR